MMVSELQSEIRENLQRYIDGASLSEFEDWFMPLLWELSDSADGEPKKLAGTISNLIAEYSGGHLNQAQLRRELAVAIRPFEVSQGTFHIFSVPSFHFDIDHLTANQRHISIHFDLPKTGISFYPLMRPGNSSEVEDLVAGLKSPFSSGSNATPIPWNLLAVR